ncbi:MAG: type II 3-dehydroquinate dehydratase [Bacteroidota bacterium]
MKIMVINGPNLNLLGIREPEIYGNQSFSNFFEQLVDEFPDVDLHYYQTNFEGDIITKLQETGFDYDGIILNAAGYTHTSVAIRDAIALIKAPVVEVHISNIHAREPFRHQSMLAGVCKGSIVGLGLDGYRLAIRYFEGGR